MSVNKFIEKAFWSDKYTKKSNEVKWLSNTNYVRSIYSPYRDVIIWIKCHFCFYFGKPNISQIHWDIGTYFVKNQRLGNTGHRQNAHHAVFFYSGGGAVKTNFLFFFSIWLNSKKNRDTFWKLLQHMHFFIRST